MESELITCQTAAVSVVNCENDSDNTPIALAVIYLQSKQTKPAAIGCVYVAKECGSGDRLRQLEYQTICEAKSEALARTQVAGAMNRLFHGAPSNWTSNWNWQAA